MKINIEVLFVVILIIINLIISGFFLYLITFINAPEIHADIDLTRVTSDEIVFETNLNINNPNPFDININKISVLSKTIDGNKFTEFSFDGGIIPSNNQKILSQINSINFTGDIPNEITNVISAEIGVKFFGFIEKTLPIEAIVNLSIEKILDNITVPDIVLNARIIELTENGIKFQANIELTNPSDIQLQIEDVNIEMKTDQNKQVGSVSADSGILKPRGILNLEASGELLYIALDAKEIIINLTGEATGIIAGITQSLTLSALSIIEVPNLTELLSLDNDSLKAIVEGEFKIRLRGLITTVRLKIYNPTNIPLESQDLVCGIYGVVGENQKLLAEKEMEVCLNDSIYDICMESELIIKFFKLLTSGTGRIIPESLTIHLEGNISITGTDQTIPLTIDGVLDPRILR
jgi:LEA14-like dessication related protein